MEIGLRIGKGKEQRGKEVKKKGKEKDDINKIKWS